MSKTEKDPAFYQMADEFIGVANQLANKDTEAGKVSAAFLYAAARYNTFIVASSADSALAFQNYQETAKEYFLAEYKKMLDEHMADYAAHFDHYLKNPDSSRRLN